MISIDVPVEEMEKLEKQFSDRNIIQTLNDLSDSLKFYRGSLYHNVANLSSVVMMRGTLLYINGLSEIKFKNLRDNPNAYFEYPANKYSDSSRSQTFKEMHDEFIKFFYFARTKLKIQV